MADQLHFVTQSSKLGNERETRDRVLDTLTIKTLNKLINTDNVIERVEGCLSSGKEANVYHCIAPLPSNLTTTTDNDSTPATAPEQAPIQAGASTQAQAKEQSKGEEPARKRSVAVKVYATTVNIFKTRQVYMQGWHNTNGVRSGREMIAQWATNEFNHLRRLRKAGIPCPEPIEHRDNVVVMSLLGSDDSVAFPRLQNVNLEKEEDTSGSADVKEEADAHGDPEQEPESTPTPVTVPEKWASLYTQLLGYMRRMFKIARLVHGDLSEYNILYSPAESKLYVIDVSQSLEHDHPECLSMLRMDISNVNTFFRRKKVDVLAEQTIFEFVTTDDAPLDEEGMYKKLEELYDSRTTAATEEDRAREEVEENEFRTKFIPRTLGEAYEMEAVGVPADRTAIAHLLVDGNGGENGEEEEEEKVEESDEEDGSDAGAPLHSGDEEDDDFFVDNNKTPRGKKHMDKAEKLAHKAAVKEAKREQRATKMPKKVKAALIAKTSKPRTKKR